MIKEVEFMSNNSLLRGKIFIPSTSEGRVAIMATGDGLSGSKSSTWTGLTEAFYNAGIPCFLFDFAGLGYSSGETSKLNITIGLLNMQAAISVILNEKWVNPNRIGILGSSFGGNVALLYTAYHGGIKTLGLKSPASFYPETQELELGNERMGSWKEKGYDPEYGFDYSFYLDGMDYNTYCEAKKIKCSCFIVHGDSDTVVPIQQSKRLVHSLTHSEEVSLKILVGVNHDYKQGDSKEVMTDLLLNWFKNKL